MSLETRQSTTPIRHARGHLFRRLAKACRPKIITTVSAWADRFRILTSKGSAEIGRWRTDRTPYLREILDQLSVTSPTQRIVLQFAAQLGKTEVGLNWIGYVMEHAPGPMLVVVPTLEVRKRWVRQRLDPMLSETPVLRDIFKGQRSRDGANTEELKDFPGGMVVIGGANSAASLASMPIRYVLCDEVDRFPWEVGEEGDPLGLIDERTKSFQRRKVLLVSTPTVTGASRIESEYENSDQREYHVPCPSCGHYQVLRWRRDDGSFGLVHIEATGAVRYACEACGDLFDEHHKPKMLAAGRWIARHPERKARGYHLNGLYSPLGLGFTWNELWAKWQAAHGDTAALKRFINTTLGETWRESGASIDDLALIARLEDYADTLPIGLITAGVDVQKDRLEASIVGWHHSGSEEAWLLDHLIIPGETALPEVWDALRDELKSADVSIAVVDSGYNTTFVNAFCEQHRWAVPGKGTPGLARPLVEDAQKRLQRMRKRRKKGIPSEPIGVDQGKALIYARLRLIDPGPQYIHFPADPAFDDEYFAQLAAEELRTKAKGNRTYQEWVQTRPRNEALDCLVYATAAMRLASVEQGGRRSSAGEGADAQKARPTRRQSFVNRWRQ